MKVLVALCLLSSIIADSEPDADPALTYSLYGNLYGNVGYPSGYSAYQGYNNNGYPIYNGYSNYPNYQFMFPSNTPAPVTSYQPSLTNNFIPGYPLNQALNYHPPASHCHYSVSWCPRRSCHCSCWCWFKQ